MTSRASLHRPALPASGGLRAWLRRLLPLLLVLSAVLMLLWVAMQRDLGSAQAAVPDGDAMLVLLIATAVSAAGLGALAMLLLVRRLARRMPSFLGLPPAASALAFAGHGVAPDRAAAQQAPELAAGLVTIGLWRQDRHGRYTAIEPAHHQRTSRMTELVGRRRAELGTGEPACEGLEGPLPFHGAQWTARLGDGQLLRLRESGMPQFATDGQIEGWCGTIEQIDPVPLEEQEQNRLATLALAAVPVAAMLLQRSLPAHEAGRRGPAWQLAWGNQALGVLTERGHPELQRLDPGHWLVCAPPEGHAENGRLARSGGGPVLRQLLDQQEGARAEGLVIDRYGRRHAVTVTLEPLGRDSTLELTLVIIDSLRPELEALRNERLRDRAQDEAREKRAIETEMATRELEAFSHSVSHDLRHPVNLIDGFARILQEDYAHLLDPAGRDHVMRILNASHRMHAMIDALLETHRISAQAVVPDPVDLSSLASGIADELRDRDPAIRSKIKIEPGMACRGDRVLLRMLVWNLFENAWKYSARSRCREIHFDTLRVHDSQVFRIRDNGIGFDMRFADQIFGLFHRLHGSTEFAGSGVGLATVQRIVRRHRGRIWVESEPGKGSTFFFTLWDDA